jgi:hypothetical protein
MTKFEHFLLKTLTKYKTELSKFNNLTVMDLNNNIEKEKIYREYIKVRSAHNITSKILSQYRKYKDEPGNL